MQKRVRTADDMVVELVSDRISAVEDLVRADDRAGLEARLTDLFTAELYADIGVNPWEAPKDVFDAVRVHYEREFCVQVEDADIPRNGCAGGR